MIFAVGGRQLSDAVSSSETHTEYARNHHFKHDQTLAFFVPCSIFSQCRAVSFVPKRGQR